MNGNSRSWGSAFGFRCVSLNVSDVQKSDGERARARERDVPNARNDDRNESSACSVGQKRSSICHVRPHTSEPFTSTGAFEVPNTPDANITSSMFFNASGMASAKKPPWSADMYISR